MLNSGMLAIFINHVNIIISYNSMLTSHYKCVLLITFNLCQNIEKITLRLQTF